MKFLLLVVLSLFISDPIELEKRKVLDDKIEILIPKDFKKMSTEMLDIKYNGQNKPTLVFTDEEATVNIAFNHLQNPANDKTLEAYKNAIKSSFQKSFPNALWKGDGVKEINGKKFGYVKLITEAIDQKVYNSLFITHCEGKLLIGTFNCTESLLSKWEKTSEEIIESVIVR